MLSIPVPPFARDSVVVVVVVVSVVAWCMSPAPLPVAIDVVVVVDRIEITGIAASLSSASPVHSCGIHLGEDSNSIGHAFCCVCVEGGGEVGYFANGCFVSGCSLSRAEVVVRQVLRVEQYES